MNRGDWTEMTRQADPSTVPLGQVIQNAREAADLTQEELAVALNVQQQTISRWESGHMIPTIDKFEPIAKVLKIDPSALSAAAMKQATEKPNSMADRMEAVEQRADSLEALVNKMARRLGVEDLLSTLDLQQQARAAAELSGVILEQYVLNALALAVDRDNKGRK